MYKRIKQLFGVLNHFLKWKGVMIPKICEYLFIIGNAFYYIYFYIYINYIYIVLKYINLQFIYLTSYFPNAEHCLSLNSTGQVTVTWSRRLFDQGEVQITCLSCPLVPAELSLHSTTLTSRVNAIAWLEIKLKRMVQQNETREQSDWVNPKTRGSPGRTRTLAPKE